MSNFSHYPMQQAIYDTLSSDGTLGAFITGVFDRAPQGTAFPYVTIGEADSNDWSSKTSSGMEQMLTIHVWSREGGRKEAASVMERIYTLLNLANLTVAGQTLVLLRFLKSAILMENDGWTYHGVMQFHALLEANS